MAVIKKAELIRRFGDALSAGDASLFVGAGASQASGYVNWRNLLREIAEDLGLDVDMETDLVALAQFHVNERGGRAKINDLLVNEFTKSAVLTSVHREIAALPIASIWTTNYDDLLERAFGEARKKTDVKTSTANLAQTIRDREVIIYKMHGDRQQPHEAVLTREDYETFNETREAFSIALQGDLVEKTFLFVGFSFTDPNIDHILARIRGLLGKSQRDHFCIMKRPDLPSNASPEDTAKHEYAIKKLNLRIADLSRYRIQTVLLDSYGEIPEIFAELNRRSHLKDVLVSGSSAGPENFGSHDLDHFCRLLGSSLIRSGLNLVSGFGLGVGSSVAYGALNEIYGQQLETSRVRLLPFPQVDLSSTARGELFTKHRETMISQVGFVIFVSGNRNKPSGERENAPGVLEEFAIGAKTQKIPVPISASGSSAAHIWNEVASDKAKFFRGIDVDAPFKALAEQGQSDDFYIEAALEIIRRCSR